MIRGNACRYSIKYHRYEYKLLHFVTLAIVAGSAFFWFGYEGDFAINVLQAAAVLALAFYACSVWSYRRNSPADPFLLPIVGMLSVLSFIFLLRLNPDLAFRQFTWILLGLAGMLAVSLYNYEKLLNYKYMYIITGLIFLILTVIAGLEVGGARNWLELGFFRFQPAEMVKLLMVLFLASYLDENRELLKEGEQYGRFNIPAPQALIPLLLVIGLALIMLVLQRDLGTALIFFLTFLIMFYLASGRGDYIALGILLFSAGSVTSYFMFGHVQVRIAAWLHPWAYFEGSGYQIAQSLFALGSGGLCGSGLGLGRPDLIPAVETDFIFSAVGEEMGFLGSAGIVILYLILLYRGFKIALETSNGAGQLLAAGISCLLSVQALVIVGGVTRLLPLTGIVLPFMGYGGSSLIINYVLVGLLASISRRKKW